MKSWKKLSIYTFCAGVVAISTLVYIGIPRPDLVYRFKDVALKHGITYSNVSAYNDKIFVSDIKYKEFSAQNLKMAGITSQKINEIEIVNGKYRDSNFEKLTLSPIKIIFQMADRRADPYSVIDGMKFNLKNSEIHIPNAAVIKSSNILGTVSDKMIRNLSIDDLYTTLLRSNNQNIKITKIEVDPISLEKTHQKIETVKIKDITVNNPINLFIQEVDFRGTNQMDGKIKNEVNIKNIVSTKLDLIVNSLDLDLIVADNDLNFKVESNIDKYLALKSNGNVTFRNKTNINSFKLTYAEVEIKDQGLREFLSNNKILVSTVLKNPEFKKIDTNDVLSASIKEFIENGISISLNLIMEDSKLKIIKAN